MDEKRLRDLHDHLAATAERPVERTASRWLGEAEAIADDIAHGEMDASAQRERLGKVEHLLENVEETGDEDADGHVAAAEAILGELLTEG
ncbi:hypothetical protein [Haloarcula salinisoli]|uniref:DUF8152 domain-containing protein n=1 Tax=Haloarcula salinisoli TaxID=2487746 RepID=A0A8J7YGC7_9EURY|nr:hypothetical protein [Halomicroarcula salinisoli]MBX0286303.1 hypothetical protein [Halomicroarcula salinisoli]MBX0302209.1 hypothetical protein [Halomicroarcula salinisoli]